MINKALQRFPEILLLFGLFLLSNISAFLTLVWLISSFVFLQTLAWLILTGLLIMFVRKWDLGKKLVNEFKTNWVIFPFLIFCGVSVLWSVDQEITVYRWLILFCTILVGAYVGLRYDLKGIVEIFSIFCVLILLMSGLLVFLAPSIGIMNYYIIQGAWKGIYWHKNHMGLIAAFANVLFLIDIIISFEERRRKVFVWIVLYLFALLFVYQSDSVAAYMVVLFLHGVIALALLWLRFRRNLLALHYYVFLAIFLIALIFLYRNIDYVLGFFNRNSSLTGRVPMWTYLFSVYFSQHPLFGYGLNAFWYLESHRITMQVAAGYPDPIVVSDNGFIDILMDTGYLGLISFLVFYFALLLRSIKYTDHGKGIISFFPLILVLYVLLANISWSLIFENESFFILVMTSVLFSIAPGKNLSSDEDRLHV